MTRDSNFSDRSSNAFICTPLYVSPEMLSHEVSSPAMDLWATGCMIYQMLVGKTPFHAESEPDVYDKILAR